MEIGDGIQDGLRRPLAGIYSMNYGTELRENIEVEVQSVLVLEVFLVLLGLLLG